MFSMGLAFNIAILILAFIDSIKEKKGIDKK